MTTTAEGMPARRRYWPAIRGLRWWIVALVCLGTIANYLTRNSLAVLAPQLKSSLHFSTQQYSYVVAAFQLAYTLMQPVCGLIIDTLGLRLSFALFAIAWSVTGGLHAVAGGWPSLAAFRAVLGLSQASAIQRPWPSGSPARSAPSPSGISTPGPRWGPCWRPPSSSGWCSTTTGGRLSRSPAAPVLSGPPHASALSS